MALSTSKTRDASQVQVGSLEHFDCSTAMCSVITCVLSSSLAEAKDRASCKEAGTNEHLSPSSSVYAINLTVLPPRVLSKWETILACAS
eukprot:5080683-Amphidinium_carterae.1